MIFFPLGSNKIDKKQKFGTFDIVESRSKEMWSLSYVPWMIDVFLFLALRTLKLMFIIILPTDQPKIIPPTARTTKN